jgi:hypothetical protein
MKKTNHRPIKSHINDLCEQAGCSEKQKINHAWKWEVKRWHSHPLPSFLAWWEPDDTDPVSGASVGGHPKARRVWAIKDSHGWTRRWYGTPALDAWNTAEFLQQFDEWQNLGSPEKEPFISRAASKETQSECWHDLGPLLHAIGTLPPTKKKLADYFNFKELIPKLFSKYGVMGEPLPDWDKACESPRQKRI